MVSSGGGRCRCATPCTTCQRNPKLRPPIVEDQIKILSKRPKQTVLVELKAGSYSHAISDNCGRVAVKDRVLPDFLAAYDPIGRLDHGRLWNSIRLAAWCELLTFSVCTVQGRGPCSHRQIGGSCFLKRMIRPELLPDIFLTYHAASELEQRRKIVSATQRRPRGPRQKLIDIIPSAMPSLSSGYSAKAST